MSAWRWNIGRLRWEGEHAHIVKDARSGLYVWTVAGFSKSAWRLSLAQEQADRVVARYAWQDGEPALPASAYFDRVGIERLKLGRALEEAGDMWDEATAVTMGSDPLALHVALEYLRKSPNKATHLGKVLEICAKYGIAVPDDRWRWAVPRVGAPFVLESMSTQSCEACS